MKVALSGQRATVQASRVRISSEQTGARMAQFFESGFFQLPVSLRDVLIKVFLFAARRASTRQVNDMAKFAVKFERSILRCTGRKNCVLF